MAARLDAADLGRRAEAMLEELAAISAEPERIVRLFLTPEHRQAAALVAQWMREVGLEVGEDALGNVRGRLGSPPYLVLGSHIDSVIDAGRYDGPLGVVAPILALDALQRSGTPVATGIEVIAFGDEEGSRFPSTLSTSAAVAGIFDAAQLELLDRDGVRYADALRAYGKDPAAIPAAALAPGAASAFVEVHIEQGPVLEAGGRPLGVVSSMVGQTRLRVTVTGMAGHAGTVPMPLRRDALAGAAELIALVERIAHDFAAERMVATVGGIEADPGAVNIIAGAARFPVDLRAESDAARDEAVRRFEREAREIAARRKLGLAVDPIHAIATTPCDPQLRQALGRAIESVGASPLELPSGAGHDGMMMARLCPVAMLFVRCRDGVSHNPLEYASPQDMGLAIAALANFVETWRAPA